MALAKSPGGEWSVIHFLAEDPDEHATIRRPTAKATPILFPDTGREPEPLQ